MTTHRTRYIGQGMPLQDAPREDLRRELDRALRQVDEARVMGTVRPPEEVAARAEFIAAATAVLLLGE